MMTPTSGSSRASSNASRSSNNVRGRKALRTSGRQIVILAIPSAVSYATSVQPSGVPGFQSAPGLITGHLRRLVRREDSGSNHSYGQATDANSSRRIAPQAANGAQESDRAFGVPGEEGLSRLEDPSPEIGPR